MTEAGTESPVRKRGLVESFFVWLLGEPKIPDDACWMCLHNPAEEEAPEGLCEGCKEYLYSDARDQR